MCGSMVDIQSAAAEIRRGIKKDRKKLQGKNIMSASATQGGHKNRTFPAIILTDRQTYSSQYFAQKRSRLVRLVRCNISTDPD